MSDRADARRNLRLYPWYLAGSSFFAWMPIFFLYFAARVTVSEVLTLEAIYYASVVLLEVPSGYVSDRYGRRNTLVIAAGALVVAYLIFCAAGSFAALACGQAFLAVGLAFNSGTDTSFHLATLEQLGEAERYASREAKLASLTFVVAGLAAIAGGAVALIELRLAYALALLGAVVALVAALSCAHVERESAPSSIAHSVRRCVELARTPTLGWFFAAVVVATVINHIPYEFYQPYLERLDDAPWDTAATPLMAGVHLALVQGIAALAALHSSALVSRLGPVPLVLVAHGVQLTLIITMAWWTSPWVALLLIGRSVPRALQDAPIRAVVTPHVPPSLRATYLSLQSLAGRLVFSALLLTLSMVTEDASRATQLASIAAACMVSILALASFLAKRAREGTRPTTDCSRVRGD